MSRIKSPVLIIVLCLILDIALAAGLVTLTYYGTTLGKCKFRSLNIPTASISQRINFSSTYGTHFSKSVSTTAHSYRSPNVSVEVSSHGIGSGSDRITYEVADVFISNMKCIKTIFGGKTYGIGYLEHITSMSRRSKAILAINGDSYCYNRKHLNGLLVRNGTVYRSARSSGDVCVLYKTGRMAIYSPSNFSASKCIKDGALDTWVFGPSLLTANGHSKSVFTHTWNYIRDPHSRTAIGYYAPGHYCFVTVDKKSGVSAGMPLSMLSKIFEGLGCKSAYNLDGGHMSFMAFRGKVVNTPLEYDKKIPDSICICDVSG